MQTVTRTGAGRPIARFFGKGRWVAFLLLGLLVAARGADPWWVEAPRLSLFDQFQKLKPRESGELQVMVVDIDEASLAALGQWPWPRKVIADMVTRLMQAGAKIVGFDAVFAEPDRLSPEAFAASTPDLPRDIVDRLNAMPANDAYFARTLAQTRAVLGLPGSLEGAEASTAPKPRQPAVAVRNLVNSDDDPRRYLVAFPNIVGNIPELENAAAGRGLFSINPERDAIVRRVPAVARVEGAPNPYPTLAVEMLRVLSGSSTLLIRSQPGVGIQDVVLQEAKIVIPTDPHGRLYPHFAYLAKERYVSAKDVVLDRFPQQAFADKIVLIGASAAGLRDIRSTPLEGAAPGVEVHAQLLESIVSDTLLSRPDWADAAEIGAVALAGLLMIAGLPLIGPRWTLGLFLLLAGGLLSASWTLFAEQRLLLDAAFPALAALGLYMTVSYGAHVAAESDRRLVRDAFGHYLSPAMVERVAANPQALNLGGEMRPMTIMFCDLRGFTTISEMFDAEGLTTLMNRYLTPMTTIIQARDGTVDKYIGDAIMAFWNAPLDVAGHEREACRALLEMRAGMIQLNVDLKAEAAASGGVYVPLKIGMGVNSGTCCVGNMGSAQRLNYSVLGDAVNLASRLESQSKLYGVDNVVGETTIAGASDFALLELDLVQVKGKTVPTRVFSVLGDEALARDTDFLALSRSHQVMIQAYRAQKWAVAAAAIADCLPFAERFPIRGVLELYLRRIEDLRRNPPGPRWDGVYVATSK